MNVLGNCQKCGEPKPCECKPTRAELMERMNQLNTYESNFKYWACIVMYNWVIYRKEDCGDTVIFEVVGQLEPDR